MADYGEKYTDERVRQVSSRLNRIYSQAARELQEKEDAFWVGNARRDAMYRAMVAQGKMSKEDYEAWLRGQVFQGRQWAAKRDAIARTMVKADEAAYDIVNDGKSDVFAFNANYTGYEMEHDLGVDLGFGLYNRESVTRIVRDDPNLLPAISPDKIKPGEDARWYQRIVSNSVTQGIIQGEGVDDIRRRICQTCADRGRTAAQRDARTAYTGAQNAGRVEAMHQAEDLGIEVKKRWMATLDDKTRDTHRDLDGQEVNPDEPFITSNGDAIMYPGDPHGQPGDVFNCRCKVITVYPKYQRHDVRRDNETGEDVVNMTYREWEAWKAEQAQEAEQPQENINDHETIEAAPVQSKPWSSREEYEMAVANRETLYNVERKAATDWYEEQCEQAMEKLGGGFASQRVAIRMNESLSEEEKEAALDAVEEKRQQYYEIRDGLAAERDRKIGEALERMQSVFDPDYEFEKINGTQTLQESVGMVNPNYLDDVSYQINCQSCALAFEVRERGYDVVATAAPSSRGLGAESQMFYLFGHNDFEVKGTGHDNTVAVRNEMLKWGEGARAVVIIDRPSGDGHVFNAIVENGHFVVVDTQIGITSSDADLGSDVFGLSIESESTNAVRLYRTDNKPLKVLPEGWIRNR